MPQTGTQAEVNDLIKKLYKVADRAKGLAKPALRRAAKPIISAAKSKIDDSKAPHHRYKDGQKIATYYPGNLRRSIAVLPLRRAKTAVLIGPRLSKAGRAGGEFKGNRVDGYYAHFVEFGTVGQSAEPYMRPAAESAGPVALSLAVKELKAEILKYSQTLAV